MEPVLSTGRVLGDEKGGLRIPSLRHNFLACSEVAAIPGTREMFQKLQPPSRYFAFSRPEHTLLNNLLLKPYHGGLVGFAPQESQWKGHTFHLQVKRISMSKRPISRGLYDRIFLFEPQLNPVLTSSATGTLSQGRPVISSGFTFLNCGRKEWASQFHGTVHEQIPFCPDSLHRNSQCKLLYSVLPPGPMATILLLA